jgi:hypothetical protein
MYTRTRLDNDAISALANTDSPGQNLKALREEALLVLHPEDFRLLASGLPTSVWGRLKDDIGRRRQPCRIIPTNPEEVSRLEAEVIIGSSPINLLVAPYRCELGSFLDTPPVVRRSDFRLGERSVENRDEFWQECVTPVLDSLPQDGRIIEYFDSYALQDSFRADQRRIRSLDVASGLAWFIQKLDEYSTGLSQAPRFLVYTEIDPGKKEFGKDRIRLALNALYLKKKPRNITVEVFAFRLKHGPNENALREALHSRTLMFNRRGNFRFNYGFRDANLQFDRRAGTEVDNLAGNWHWRSAAEPIWDELRFSALKSLRDSASRFS